MKQTLFSYTKDRFPNNFNITQGDGILEIRDGLAQKGKGYSIRIIEETNYLEAWLEFEDFAKELSEYATARLTASNLEIRTLMNRDSNLYATIHKQTIEKLFAPETKKDNGWAINIGYKKDGPWAIDNFADLLLSFILILFPYDVSAEEEGIPRELLSVGYERSFHNRTLCIAFHGYQCKACGQSMREKYGDVARKFIHVHHLHPLASGEHVPDPVKDMVPLCPNCHSIAHLRNPPYTIDEIKYMLNGHHERV